MSKIVTLCIVIAAIVPIIGFLAFGDTQPVIQPEEYQLPDITEGPRPDDSPQCAMCRQINGAESQEQCLQDFACTI